MNKPQLINFCEFDKYAVQSYCAIHNTDSNLNLGDITKVNEKEIADFNMMCGGSPCQDFSVAGKQEGAKWTCNDCEHEYNPLEAHWFERDKCPKCKSTNIEKTRSSLLVEWLRILREKKPNFAMYENVKNIVGAKFKYTFDLFINELNEYGYNTYWKILNAKGYGIPQNRERVYLIVIKKELDNGKFQFPKGFDNGIRLKDILDNEVDEKYYIKEQRLKIIQNNLGNVFDSNFIISSSQKNSYVGDGTICPALTQAMGNGGGQTPMIKKLETNKCLQVADLNHYGNDQMNRVYGVDGISPTVMTKTGGGRETKILDDSSFKVRKLTPKECWKLMGFSGEYFDKAKLAGVSDSQLYKQAGNSIVTYVLYEIYKELYKAMPYLFGDIKLSSFFSGIGAFEVALDMLYNYIITGEEQNFIKPQVD